MANDIFHLIVKSSVDSFLQVTVFVGFALLLFGFINFKTQGRFVEAIQKHKSWQPVFGAMLGITPGCGGAIFVMPLYIKGTVSFGTVVATLIATAGDSAFVVIASLPGHFILISVISFVTAIITGYAVDALDLGNRLGLVRHKTMSQEELERLNREADHQTQKLMCDAIEGCSNEHIQHIGHVEGDEIDIALHHRARGLQSPLMLLSQLVRKGAYVFWLFIGVGLVLGVMLLFQVDINSLGIPGVGLFIGGIGTTLSLFLVFGEHKSFADDSHEESELKLMSLRETFIHNSHETAFTGTWIFAAYVIYELSVYGIGGGNYAQGEAVMEMVMSSVGLLTVIIGALVGLIPGCGMQILYVGLFLKGWFPLAAVIANAISQDGDALFPLIAMDRKSSLWATVITTIPAIIVGLLLYYLEMNSALFDSFKIVFQSFANIFTG